jgi:hypothetical protein
VTTVATGAVVEGDALTGGDVVVGGVVRVGEGAGVEATEGE